MTCPHCQSADTQKLAGATDLGYSRFRCHRRRFNEGTGTPFNHLEFPTDIVFQVVVFRLMFKLSLRDLVRMFLMHGYEFSHEAVREWKNDLHRCWRSTCDASAREKPEAAGTWTKPI
jgi:transposase-like protein